MKDCIASLTSYCCSGCALPNITQTSPSSMGLGELGRALDGRDVVDEHLGRLAVQLGLLEDDERLLVQLRADGDVGDVGHVVVLLSRLMWPMALTAVRMSRFLREHVVGHDVVGHLQRGHQVHLE